MADTSTAGTPSPSVSSPGRLSTLLLGCKSPAVCPLCWGGGPDLPCCSDLWWNLPDCFHRPHSAHWCPTLQTHGLQPSRLLCPWDFPDKSPGVGGHSLLWGIFLTQGSNLGLLHCRRILYPLSHEGRVTFPERLPSTELRCCGAGTPPRLGSFLASQAYCLSLPWDWTVQQA